ncbi:MAG: hypothetical protein R3213_04535 [Flavobacteriaceae bacterium]|nr:hypothetical protein [Flavobacteriaceae bacterium]
MRISFFNIQNLYFRDHSLDKNVPKPTNNWLSEMDQLMEKVQKGRQELHRIEELSLLLGFQRRIKRRYGSLRNRGGQLILKEGLPNSEAKADLTNGCKGWLRINNYPISYESRMQKIRVLAELNSDLILLQEVEDRYALKTFVVESGKHFPGLNYNNIQVLEGKDSRGVEQAILCKEKIKINKIIPLEVNSALGQAIHFHLNALPLEEIHLLSVYISHGNQGISVEEEREKIFTRLADHYLSLCKEGKDNLLIIGTFRTPSYCYSLAPLLRQTDLKDISTHINFWVGPTKKSTELHYPKSGIKEVVGKHDFILTSPKLAKKIKAAGLIWSGRYWNDQANFRSYSSITSRHYQASDHPGLWLEI